MSIPIASDLELNSSSSASPGNASLSAVLRDSAGNPIGGGEVQFYVEGQWNGSATTDASGMAVLNLTTQLSGLQVQATFWGKGEAPPAVSEVLNPAAPSNGTQTPGSTVTNPNPLAASPASTARSEAQSSSWLSEFSIPLIIAAGVVLGTIGFAVAAALRRH
jgi:hypothetical protein